MNNIYVNTRSSIRIKGSTTIYFDPYDIEGTPCDADMIFITHEHYDHFSPEDIKKVIKGDTQVIVPNGMIDLVVKHIPTIHNIYGILPWQQEKWGKIKCQGIPAYNIDKQYHPKSNNWLGYLIQIGDETYYVMGDTDVTPEAEMVNANVIFVPIGGKYTMDATEATKFINEKQPKLAIPIHYGDTEIGENFEKVIKSEIRTKIFW